jgi:YVTN family beta-propeller protein
MKLAALFLLALSAGMAGAADLAAVTSQGAGALTLLDPASGEIRATVPLPGKPAAVSVDAARGRIFAVAVETKRLHVFDLAGRELRQVALEGAPFGLAVDPATGLAYVSDWEVPRVFEIDPGTGTILREIATGPTPSGIAIADGLMVTADRDANALSLIELSTGATRTVAVGEHPFGVTLHEGRVFTADVLANTVSVVDLASGKMVATIPTGERPYAVAFAGGEGFVTDQYGSTVTVFDVGRLEVTDTIDVGEYPEGIAPTSDGRSLVVANWFSDSVMVIDAASHEVVREIAMPEGPRAFGAFVAAVP